MKGKYIMKITKFIDTYKLMKLDSQKKDYIAKRLQKKYIPFSEKCFWCERIVEASSYDSEKHYHLNSANKYILYVTTLINLYTDIDIIYGGEESNMMEVYDLLCEYGFLDDLLSCIPEREVKEISTILEMKSNDAYENDRSINGIFDRIKDISTVVEETLNNRIVELINKDIESENN